MLASFATSAQTFRSFEFARTDGSKLAVKILPNFKMTFDGDDIQISSGNEYYTIPSETLSKSLVTEPRIEISTSVSEVNGDSTTLFKLTSDGVKLHSDKEINVVYLYSLSGSLKQVFVLSADETILRSDLPAGVCILSDGNEAIKINNDR